MDERRNNIRVWWHLFRIWSLTATIVPIWVAMCINRFACRTNFVLALLSCGALQIACNLLNTWGDYRGGVDRAGSPCSHPELVNGTVKPAHVLAMGMAMLAIGIAVAAVLIYRCRGLFWPLLAIAVIGILGVLNYATGIRFKYRGFGLICVFFLMGYLLIAAADMCLGGKMTDPANRPGFGTWLFGVTLMGLPISSLVACIMHANDMRDIEGDREAGIKTPSVIFGRKGALVIYTALHAAAYVTPLILLADALSSRSIRDIKSWVIAFGVTIALVLPMTVRTVHRAFVNRNGVPSTDWKMLLPETARIHLLYGLLYGLGCWLIIIL